MILPVSSTQICSEKIKRTTLLKLFEIYYLTFSFHNQISYIIGQWKPKKFSSQSQKGRRLKVFPHLLEHVFFVVLVQSLMFYEHQPHASFHDPSLTPGTLGLQCISEINANTHSIGHVKENHLFQLIQEHINLELICKHI